MTETTPADDPTLSDLVGKIPIALLTTSGPDGLQGRPLAVQRVDDDARAVWFLVADDADWLPSATGPANIGFVDDGTWVSVAGTGATTTDPAVLEDLGDPISDTWFNEGKQPVALRVDVAHVDWWSAPGRLRQLAGYAKAALTDQEPDVGSRGEID